MRLRKLILLLPFLCWAFVVRAQDQIPQQISSMPEQWQLTLDVIKSKAQSLLVENNGLQAENQQLIELEQRIRQSIAIQQYKNEQMEQFIKERNNKTDQQVRIEELSPIVKTKKQQLKILDGQLENLSRKKEGLDRKIQLLKYTISDLELHNQAQQQKAPVAESPLEPQADDQLIQLRKQIEDESRQEVVLENELNSFKNGTKAQNMNVDTIDEENEKLEARLDVLRLQKLQIDKKSSEALQSQANGRKYEELKKHKDHLEADISAYESRLDELRESSLMAISWPLKRKKLVHEMVQTDARNNEMKEKIKELREDIDVLRDQVAKLERRVDFVKGAAQ